MLQPRFFPFPQLQTERLILRKISSNDTAALYHLRSSELVMRYIDKPRAKNLTDAQFFVQVVLDNLAKNEGITWAISFKEQPATLIGTIGFWRLIKEHDRAEIGYMLHPEHWRKGLMKEALQVVIPYGFQNLKLHSVEARINPGNEASDAILRSAGFIREAYFKEDFFYNGRYLDTAIYSLLQPEMVATNR